MPPVQPQAEAASLIVGGIVLAIAGLLAWREHRDRRHRAPDPSPEDARHFRAQDLRRGAGVIIMVVLAIGLVVGTRVDPRQSLQSRQMFIATWLVVSLLILGLLALALFDWIALRIYAGRVRRAISRERVAILTDELQRRRASGGNGRAHGPVDDLL
ncbi:hypothetical protein TA3x_000920 [Tundrisphaera sp. TA3]|uniref:hypothetical protein n=1 Tax=Tundrisphaera sp. TA3 TaxID=3435775 RepID=UPI003EB70CFB